MRREARTFFAGSSLKRKKIIPLPWARVVSSWGRNVTGMPAGALCVCGKIYAPMHISPGTISAYYLPDLTLFFSYTVDYSYSGRGCSTGQTVTITGLGQTAGARFLRTAVSEFRASGHFNRIATRADVTITKLNTMSWGKKCKVTLSIPSWPFLTEDIDRPSERLS